MSKVIITVIGGVASVIQKPKNMEVEIRDYDLEDEDHPASKRDENGDLYQELIWGKGTKS